MNTSALSQYREGGQLLDASILVPKAESTAIMDPEGGISPIEDRA